MRGLRLPMQALTSLQQSGILCDPAISILRQNMASTYVIRGRESGGTVAHLGAYCGFVGESGEPLQWLESLQNVSRNGFHAMVFAPKLVRVHVFRYQESYDLLITRHRLMPQAGRVRPLLENAILFYGVRGRVDAQCHGTTELVSDPLPVFDDGFGNPISIPPRFEWAARSAILGACCNGCKHTHLLRPQQTA